MNRRRMLQSDMSRLQRNYSFLLDEIDAMVLVPKLLESSVITWDDKEAIRLQAHQQGTKAGTDKLIDILCRSGNNAYTGFMESLSINGYHHVVERLERDVNNQSSETVDDSKRVDDLFAKYNSQQQTINSLTQSNNQLNGEVQSLKEEVRCIKHQHGAQKTEKPTNNEKEKRPITCEKMSPEQQTRARSTFSLEALTALTEVEREFDRARAPFRARERPLTDYERARAAIERYRERLREMLDKK